MAPERHQFRHQREPDSFARAYDTMHGASVCALGFSVETWRAPCGAQKRCKSASFSQPLGPGELHIPSVHGVGGSLLYFMEAGDESRIWDSEFDDVAAPTFDGRAGLLRVDHVAQTMQYEEMLSWLLYYYSLFDVIKTPQSRSRIPSVSCQPKPLIRQIVGCVSRSTARQPRRLCRRDFCRVSWVLACSTLRSRRQTFFATRNAARRTRPRNVADPTQLLRGSRGALRSRRALFEQLAD